MDLDEKLMKDAWVAPTMDLDEKLMKDAWVAPTMDLDELEQIERLRSEDIPPPPHDYPHYWVMLDAKSKQGRMTLKI